MGRNGHLAYDGLGGWPGGAGAGAGGAGAGWGIPAPSMPPVPALGRLATQQGNQMIEGRGILRRLRGLSKGRTALWDLAQHGFAEG